MKENSKHIKELDGVRGTAIILVMLFHFIRLPFVSHNGFDSILINILHLGWIGVDLFFVLSGYLITRILLTSKPDETYKQYSGRFYKKRFLRIFPLYYTYLIFIFLIFFPVVLSKLRHGEQIKLTEARNAQLWFWLYASNIKQVINGASFGALVGHLWSLSIEEQFYIFWPLVVYFASIQNLKRIITGMIAGAFVLRVIGWQFSMNPSSIYVFTFTRIDTLAVGALIAVLSFESRQINYQRVKAFCAVIAMFALPLIYFYKARPDNHPVVYTIGYSLIAFMFGSLIFILQSGYPFKLKKLFRNRILIFMGKYSYALYLFHPFVRKVLLTVFGRPQVMLGSQMPWMLCFITVCFAASLVLALISWYAFERWFLQLKSKV